MAILSRIGTALLMLGGIALAALMGYTLWLDSAQPTQDTWFGLGGRAVEIAVVTPERDDLLLMRQAIQACADQGLLQLERDPGELILVTPRRGIRARVVWRRASGQVETRDTVRALLDRERPVALIGSSNTALTVALAEALRGAAPERSGPLLLVPWATANHIPSADRNQPAEPLLDLYEGRAFRLCPNNQRQADLVVRCVLAKSGRPQPSRVVLMTDRTDPYSVDLAAGFEAAIRTALPGAEIVVLSDPIASPGLAETPGPTEDQTARRVWEMVPSARMVWVVLPMQTEPTRRMLAALRAQAPADPASPLEILCGDGIGAETLESIAGTRAYGIWCASPDRQGEGGGELGRDLLVPAEAIAALVAALDRSGTDLDALRDAFRQLDLKATDPAALGRSLAFDGSGERRGGDLGQVLSIRPGRSEVSALIPRAGGGWEGPRTVTPTLVVTPP